MLFLLPFVLFVSLGFAATGWVITFHLNRYAVPGDHTPLVRTLFLFGHAFFCVLTYIALFLALRS